MNIHTEGEGKSHVRNRKLIEGEDIPFGLPPEEYSYRCSQCNREVTVNEAIIDVEIEIAEFEGRYYESFRLPWL